MTDWASSELDRWLSPAIRGELEQLYYAEVNSQARFEALSRDPAFLDSIASGEAHAGLFADHGVVHVRDVARQTLNVLNRVHGLLIARRPPGRFALMQGYGVLLAYFHDIGMFDFSAFGRAMHPEFATHSVFNPSLDPIVDAIWQENAGNLAWRLTRLADEGALKQPPQVVLREMLAFCMGHSKSKVPIDVLNDPARLREALIEAALTDLRYLYGVQRVKRARQKLIVARQSADVEQATRWEAALAAAENALVVNQAADSINPDLRRYYPCLPDDAFRWLLSDHPAVRELVQDAVDTTRVLRCADALRQRGGVLKTSGGYEIFVSRQTARAIFSLQMGDSGLYLLEFPDAISAGEANVFGSELDAKGDLHITFHRGAFATIEAMDYAVESAARVIEDIAQDCINSFQRPAGERPAPPKTAEQMQLLLEETDDSVDFAARVRERVEEGNPWLRGRVQLIPCLSGASDQERALYLAARPADWNLATRVDLLKRLGRSGHRVGQIDPERAFKDARLVELRAGDVLLEAGAPAAFVYIPMGPGLKIIPLGGYETFAARAWTPIGVTGVIRGATRNSTVVAEMPMRLLMIPKGVYLRDWHYVHTPETFIEALEADLRAKTTPPALSTLEKSLLLRRVSLFAEVEDAGLMALATETGEALLPDGTVVFEKGATGDSLYVVVSGAVSVRDGGRELERLGPGAAFGEMAILTAAARMALVVTDGETRLLSLPGAVFDAFLRTHGEVARSVISVLATRLRDRSTEVAHLPAGHEPGLERVGPDSDLI